MAQTADMPELANERVEAVSEGHKMSRTQGRRLPAELLLAIGDQLCDHRDIVAFGLTCGDLYALLLQKRRPSLMVVFDRFQTACTACHGCPRTATRAYRLLNQRCTVLELPQIGYIPDYPERKLEACSHCIDAKRTVAASQLFSQNSCRLAKSIKKLTLSGALPYGLRPCSLASYPFIQSVGFKYIRPETFTVDMGWRDWDMDVLQGMSVTNLKFLKLPMSLPSDCVRLGKALTVMPNLESLAITDIPDREEFLTELEHIGKGIISCAPTLRELDIEMTNYNHPVEWERDETFIEPEDSGFFFRKIFPCPTEEELLALCKRHSRHDTDPTNEAPLGFRKLRLKHVNLPWDSFGTIFKAATIKHLQLPYSKAEEQVWGLLEKHGQLDTLTDISYDMLSTGFLSFLAGQSSLKEMTFARPQDQYEARAMSLYDGDPHMSISVFEEAHRLGPDIGAKYPSLEEFLSSLEHMTMLKHLVLPADMYTITPGCLLSVAASLTGLEHLELGFDYGNTELQQVFASCFLCGTQTPKKLTFLSLKQPQPLQSFDSTLFRTSIASLGDNVSANLKLVRYMPLDPSGNIEVYYHRETPVDGEWWLRLPQDESEKMFSEGRTPRIVPVGKWGWETESENFRVGQECFWEATSQASE